MTYTFAKAHNGEVGKSICELDKLDVALGVEELAKKNGVELVMAPDAVCAPEFSNDAPQSVHPSNAIPADLEGLDAGPEAQKLFAEAIKGCKTILWNGPAGVFEFDNPMEEGMFGFLKQYDDYDEAHYREIVEKRRIAGKKGAESRWNKAAE